MVANLTMHHTMVNLIHRGQHFHLAPLLQISYLMIQMANQDSFNHAVILPELQSKDSILAIHYTLESLGFSGNIITTPQLKIAYSSDKISWSILPTSVQDSTNRTVAALTKPDGYYAIVQSGSTYSAGISNILGADTKVETRKVEGVEDTLDLEVPSVEKVVEEKAPSEPIVEEQPPSIFERVNSFIKGLF